MATLTLRKQEPDTTAEHPHRHKLLIAMKERFASFLTQLSGPPRTKRNRGNDQLFNNRFDILYPRG